MGEIQTLIGQDCPIVHVVNPYQISATSARVTNFQAYPLENYKIDAHLGAA